MPNDSETQKRAREIQAVDTHVGVELRRRRLKRGISQTELGERVGVTFQQVQKYEKGTNRVAASRLWQICRALECTITELFPPLDAEPTAPDPNLRVEGIDRLIADYARLDGRERRAVRAVASSLAEPRDGS